MKIYYIPYNFKNDYVIGSYYKNEDEAVSAACEWWCENGRDHDDVDGYGAIRVEVIDANSPYATLFYCVDDSYDCDWDSESGFFAIAPYGVGSTEVEAIEDYIDQRS